MSAKPANVVSSLGTAADPQANAAKAAGDASCAKDVAQKKTVSVDNAAQSADGQPPQMFEQVLSNASAAQKPDAKAPAAKTKVAAADAADTSKTEEPASPDIALLISLLPALPQNGQPAAVDPTSSLPAQDDAIAAVAVSSATSGRAAAAPASPLMPQADAPNASVPVMTAAPTAASDLPTANENPLGDKADLFTAILAKADTSASTPSPMLALPTHQAPTLTAVAQAVPVTAPGVLDELPVTHGEWPAALGHRMLWAVGEGIQKVELSVTPQDMGPINVHIRVENDKADIRFTAAHAMTRDALEASIPRLRDMFSQQGLNLSQAQVFSQTSQDTRGRQPDSQQAQTGMQANTAADAQEPERAQPIYWRCGLVDDYA